MFIFIMNNFVISLIFIVSDRCEGRCNKERAKCIIDGNIPQCRCWDGYHGDGIKCEPINFNESTKTGSLQVFFY